MSSYKVTHSDGKVEYYDSAARTIGLHRVDGPAIEFPNGDKWYCQLNKLHRLDGPAIERANGNHEYWIDGVKLSETEYRNMVVPVQTENDLTPVEDTVIIGDTVEQTEKATEIVTTVLPSRKVVKKKKE